MDNMPSEYKKLFPSTMAILDCTELKIQKPSSLVNQSMTYSNYKSSNTVKGLIAIDPRGSLMFASMLYSGSIFDKDIYLKSGLHDFLKEAVNSGWLQPKDCIMVDKGFRIHDDLESIGLHLDIPPFASSSGQMSCENVNKTQKIAKWRVHVERHMAAVKRFKIISQKVSMKLLPHIDHIWFVCNCLTTVQPPIIKLKIAK